MEHHTYVDLSMPEELSFKAEEILSINHKVT